MFSYPSGTPGLENGNDNGDNGGGNADCKDKNVEGRQSDCPQTKYLCTNPIYKDLMTIQCPQTCKLGCAAQN